MTKELDIKILRNCFGKFATGITVITALAPDGTKIGLTVNSFSSLSLEPPLVLWSLDKKSKSLSAFIAATHFAINVLASDQMDISNNFARTSDDKFNNIKLSESKYDLPLLSGTVAHLECKILVPTKVVIILFLSVKLNILKQAIKSHFYIQMVNIQ